MPKRLPDDVPWGRTGKTVGEGGQGGVHEVDPKDSNRFHPIAT